MQRLLLSLIGSLTLALLAACAGLEEPPVNPDPEPQTKKITMGLVNSLQRGWGSQSGGFAWELTVDPNEIFGGQLFAVDLRGKAIFDERFLNAGQLLVEGGFQELLFTDLQATVRVRDGAIGDPVLLTVPESIQRVCWVSGTACDPDNDLPGTGVRGNTDCQPQGEINPCGLFVKIPTDHDCEPGGVCDELGHTGDGSQCAANQFCVAGPIELPLTGPPAGGSYVADASGSVLFGFDDTEDTGFTELNEGGCNDGTWYRDDVEVDDPLGPNALRGLVGGVSVAIEFVMAEDSRGDDGIDSCDGLASPTPDSKLVKFPILTP